MSRALLIVICDFLLLSLLALAKFDIEQPEPQRQDQEVAPDYSGGKTDLVEVLTFALEQEQESRAELTEELSRVQEALAQSESEIQRAQENLRQKDVEARRLDAERSALLGQYREAQESVQELQGELQSTATRAEESQDRIQELETQLLARQEAAERMQRQLEELERNRSTTEEERRRLAGELQVAQAETKWTRSQLRNVQDEVRVVREEKEQIQEHATKLAQGVSELASRSDELTQEIRDYRPLPANTIFNEFIGNRIRTRFQAARQGFLGRTVDRTMETKTVLVTDGEKVYSVYHVDSTPFNFGEAGTDWNSVTGYVLRQGLIYSIPQIAFLSVDPRLMVVPVGKPQAEKLGTKIYRVANDPYRFSEAVVVDGDEGYYGEAGFRVDTGAPGYLKMDRDLFRRLSGDFVPSQGDLVFAKSGELLGIMVNNEYCAVLEKIYPARYVRLGSDLSTQRTGQVVAQMRDWKERLPFRLQ